MIPAEVENVLIQHSVVEDETVFGVPDSVLDEQVRAAVIPSLNQTLDEAELIYFY